MLKLLSVHTVKNIFPTKILFKSNVTLIYTVQYHQVNLALRFFYHLPAERSIECTVVYHTLD